EIDHDLAGPQVRRRGRVAARETQVGVGRQRCEFIRGVAERLGNGPHAGGVARQRAGRRRGGLRADLIDDGFGHCSTFSEMPVSYRWCRPSPNRGNIMPLAIELEQEDDGRWIAEVPDLPGVMTYGATRQEAIERAQVLTLRVLAERLEHGETVP